MPCFETGLLHLGFFAISLENGTAYRPEETDTYRAIGTRMLLQLCTDDNDQPSTRKRLLDAMLDNYEAPRPWNVITLLAKYERRSLKDATIIIVVDGLQTIMDTSAFYRTMNSIGELALMDTFFIACCTATITIPVERVLKKLTEKGSFFLLHHWRHQ
jgi:hypothetical protein